MSEYPYWPPTPVEPPQVGQTPYTPPQHGQPQYTQPQYGQPQYTPPQYGPPQIGQQLYGQPVYISTQQEVLRQQHLAQEKKQLRQFGNRAGAGMLAFNLLSTILGVVLVALDMEDALDNFVFLCALNGIGSILGVFLPYLYIVMRSGQNSRPVFRSLGKPYQTSHMLLSVPIGFAVCMFANYITNIFVSLVEEFGITLSSPDLSGGSAPLELFTGVLAIAIIPALTEEFAMRGVVMQPLRRYGDRFAIVASAVLFGAMHGNLVQAPFALLVGLAVGYFTVLTGSLWTGVLIHFANNLFSVLVSAGLDYFGEENQRFYNWVLAFEGLVILVAVVCTVLLRLKTGKRQLCPPSTDLGTGQKYAAFFTAPCMIIALILLAVNTLTMIDF